MRGQIIGHRKGLKSLDLIIQLRNGRELTVTNCHCKYWGNPNVFIGSLTRDDSDGLFHYPIVEIVSFPLFGDRRGIECEIYQWN